MRDVVVDQVLDSVKDELPYNGVVVLSIDTTETDEEVTVDVTWITALLNNGGMI